MLAIRKATPKDLEAITEIYNEAILHTVASFDTQPKTMEEQKAWFTSHDQKHPILVAENEGAVAGWASLSKWSDRCAYSDTAEASLYVREGHRSRGIGRKLLHTIIQEGEKAGLHTIIARITEGNAASLHLFKSEGFEQTGIMKEVGRKFGKRLDVHIMQKIYNN
ncbi:MAG: N-acetyltransferase family protein [Candidatus Bathyarchaeia archaeon]